jgi:hypothetical protein
MASTYSTLKVELIGTGDQTGTWGTTTNDNLSIALGEAITGSADVAFSSADVTVTLTDSNGAQTARNLRLNLTGTSGGARNLILGSGCQIEKLYLINNGLADAVTVKNTSGTGIAVAAGKSMFVYNNGTNVVDAVTHLSSLTLGTALPVASGGTGSTSTTFVNLASNVTGTLPIANGGTGTTSTTFANLATNVTGTLPIANGGTGTTSTTFANLATNVTGTLPVANGGTGSISLTANRVLLGNGTSGLQEVAPGSNGNVLTSNGSTWTSSAPAGGGVTSAVAGNGISVSGATGAVTFAVACPSFNSVGSYVSAAMYTNGFNITATSGSNYSAGASNGQIRSLTWYIDCGYVVEVSNNLSGTWKWMGATVTDNNYLIALACRVS